MAEVSVYDQAVVDTFRRKAIRSALLIDDQFPSYEDAVSGEMEFDETDQALALYKHLRKDCVLCDVENNIGDLTHDVLDRFRKSDLIILDYHLQKGSSDGDKAIQIIQGLAGTEHFNTVVVYTREPDLQKVWLEIAAGLYGEWKDYVCLFEEEQDPQKQETLFTLWEGLDKSSISVPRPILESYVVTGKYSKVPEWKVFSEELVGKGIPHAHLSRIADALIHQEIKNGLLRGGATAAPRPIAGSSAGPVWIQAGHCFVAIIGKQTSAEETTPEQLFKALDEAQKSWKPGIVQILVSEIQNILEVETLAYDRLHLDRPDIRAALAYFLFDAAGDERPLDESKAWAAVGKLIDKLTEILRRKIIESGSLKNLATSLLRESLPQPEGNGWKYNAALEWGPADTTLTEDSLLLALNHFLSTEPTLRHHLTTGTIFKRDVSAAQGMQNEYWLCVSPACDMVDRAPDTVFAWRSALFPVTPVLVARLQESSSTALQKAHHGKVVFLRDNGGYKCLSLTDASLDQIDWEWWFLDSSTTFSGASRDSFSARRLIKSNGEPAAESPMETISCIAVEQLRPQYANRFLQMAGQQLSRIGVDFLSKPASKKKTE